MIAPWLKRFMLAAFCAVIFLGGATAKEEAPEGTTLKTNRRLPAAEMARLCDRSVWEKLGDLDFTAYVVMDGRLDRDGRVKTRRVAEAHPDSSREQLARVYGDRVVIRGASTASRIPQKVIVYVVFYETLRGANNLAVVFAKQVGGSSESNVGGAYFKTAEY